MRVAGGVGQDVLDDPFDQFAAGLVLLAHNAHSKTRLDVFSLGAIHTQIVRLTKVRP